MPRSGGTYVPPISSWNPAVNGQNATAADWNNLLNDVSAAITASISNDGQTTPVANLPMGNNRHTGVGNAVNRNEYLTMAQAQDGGGVWLSSVAGADTITASAVPAITGYTAGQAFRFLSAGANTGAVTLNINGQGAKAITKNGTTALVAGDIPSGSAITVLYDGTQFQLQTTAQVANAVNVTGGTAVATSYNGGQLAGMRNKLINGAMGIDQRNSGSAQTFTSAAALEYTVDRWYAYCTGANVTGQRVTGTAPSQFNYQFTGAASVTKIGFAQRIEAANSQDLAGQTATLSVFLANSLLTTVTWTAWYANTADTFGTLASPTRTQIATGTFTVNSTLTRYSTQISIPAAATTGIEIEFSVAAQNSGTWTIGRAQLEIGSVATPFEHRPIGTELGLCQRYYERQAAQQYISYTTGNVGTVLSGQWSVTKRAAPTVAVGGSILALAVINSATAIGTVAWNMGVTGTGATNANHAGTITGISEL